MNYNTKNKYSINKLFTSLDINEKKRKEKK